MLTSEEKDGLCLMEEMDIADPKIMNNWRHFLVICDILPIFGQKNKNMLLHNRIDKRILKEKIKNNPERRRTLSFYKYQKIHNPKFFRDYLFIHWNELGVLGRTYVASEGINAQISVPEDRWEAFYDDLNDISFLQGIRLNFAVEESSPSFYKLAIKNRHKIVADGIDIPAFDSSNCGIHLKAQEFNDLTNDPRTIVVDMRNHYESEIGHFRNAITPDVDTFRDSLPIVVDMLKDKKAEPIVMYCTGGIRCEKASAYMKFNGFTNVYQLEGGIIEYAHQVEKKGLENKFIGKNFVFDERLGERITGEVISQCHQCGELCDIHVNCINEGCHLLFIQCDHCAEKYNHCCSDACKDDLALPEINRKEKRKGVMLDQNIFKKGRSERLPFQHHNHQDTLQPH